MRFTLHVLLALLPASSFASPFYPQIEAVSGRQSSSHRGTPPTLAQSLSTEEKPAEKLQRQINACKGACKSDRRASLADVRRSITVKECNKFCEENAQFLNEKYSKTGGSKSDTAKKTTSKKKTSVASPKLAAQFPTVEGDDLAQEVDELAPPCKSQRLCVNGVLFGIQCGTSIASRYPATAHQQARDYEACAALCQRNDCVAFDYDVVSGMCSAYPMTADFDVARIVEEGFVSGAVKGAC